MTKLIITFLLFMQFYPSQIITSVKKYDEFRSEKIAPGCVLVFNHRFVVYDQLSNTVKFLTKDFKFIQTIAGKGNGPGEVSGPKIILLEFDQKLVIIDAVKNLINLYETTGRFIKKNQFYK